MGFNPSSPNLNDILDFFLHLFESGLSYNTVNTARSALSALFPQFQGPTPLGEHPMVTRMLKGIYNVRPTQAKYAGVWDVRPVLNLLRKWSPCHKLSLKLLTFKITMLLALTTGQRVQTLHRMNLDCLRKDKGGYTCSFKEVLKHSKPSKVAPTVEVRAYPPDRRLCPSTYLSHYLQTTETLRDETTQLFISIQQPHGPVSPDTIRRWILQTLKTAGVDTLQYQAHSTRAASTSTAATMVDIDSVLKKAGWASETTFRKFYNKPILGGDAFAAAVLSQ